jgi:hypothetical protein
MFDKFAYGKALLQLNVDRLRQARDDERGMTTETVIITGILASIAVAVGVILFAALTGKATTTGSGIESADTSGGN